MNLLDVLHKTFSEELINKLFKVKLKFIKYKDIFFNFAKTKKKYLIDEWIKC